MSAVRDEIAGLPSAEAHAVVRQMRHEALAELFDLWCSLGVSGWESAHRGHMLETAVHLRQAREVMRETFGAFRELEPSLSAAIFDRNGNTETGGTNPNPKTRGVPHER
jgi:hypothetical protein